MSFPPPLPEKTSVTQKSPPQLRLEHRVRVSVLEPEHIWKLDGDKLLIGTEGQPDITIPLASICTVRLAYEPSRFQMRRYRCYLYNANGKVATIQNDHYKGIADFEDRSTTYISMMQLLIPRIASLNPNCVFKTGISILNWWLQAFMTLIVSVFLTVVIFFLYTAIGFLVVIKLLIIAFFVPTLVWWFLKNRPKDFLPRAIPEDLLPKI